MKKLLYEYYLHTKNVGDPSYHLFEKLLTEEVLYNEYKKKVRNEKAKQDNDKENKTT